MFDPYRKWLGIPEHQRPPSHYQLLGIPSDEQDLDVIEAAVLRQSAFVRNFQAGAHAEEATRILNEIASARLCLIDSKKRAKYDAELAKREAAKPASHSSARHSDLAIDVGAVPPQRAPHPPSQRASPAAPESPAPALDLDRLLASAPRQSAPVGRRTALGNRAPLGRRRAPERSAGYLWQVPLLAVICVILLLVARTIGGAIAEQRAASSAPVQTDLQDERERN